MSNTYEQFREIISLVATRNVFSCFQILTRKNNNLPLSYKRTRKLRL